MIRRFLSLILVLAILFQGGPGFAQGSCQFLLDSRSDRHNKEISDYFSAPKGRISRASAFARHFTTTRKYIERLDALEALPEANVSDTTLNQLLHKTVLNPKTPPTAADIRFLQKNKFHREIFEITVVMLATGEVAITTLQTAINYWSGRIGHSALMGEHTWRGRTLQFMRSVYNGPVRFFGAPILPLPKWSHPSIAVLDKQFKDPNFIPTEREIADLKENGAYETYAANVEFQKSHPHWRNFRRWVGRFFIAALLTNAAVVGNWALHLSGEKAFVRSENFFSEPQHRLQDNQVRIYNESVPFPHMAIEVGGNVYSYGQTHMTVTPLREYLLSGDIRDAFEAGKEQKAPVGVMNKSLHATGLDKMPRSVQSVTLHLTPAERLQLKRYLELSSFHAYRNQTLVMDCATMIAIALQRTTSIPVPPGTGTPFTIDASPSGMMMYFGILKSLGIQSADGTPVVQNINQIAMGAKDAPQTHLLRNLYINAVESRVFLSFFNWNAGQRTYMHARYGTDNFQYLNPEVRREIEGWQKPVISDLTDLASQSAVTNQIIVFKEMAAKLGVVPVNQRTPEWHQEVNQLRLLKNAYLGSEIKKNIEIRDSLESAFSDVVRSGYQVSVLLGLGAEIDSLLAGRPSTLNPGDPGSILNGILSGRPGG
ncbi:MAG: hypothetical protein ABL958_03715 [Bdellovibrionia bacterium]